LHNSHGLPLIHVSDVTVERDLTTILQDFNWSVSPGENWVIFGPNGAGKTSLLNVIQGYLWPTRGTVKVMGGTLGDGVDVREMRRLIPVVSESVRRMIHDYLTGLEVLITGARAHLDIFEPPIEAELAKAHALANATKIGPLLQKPFGVMSTGERQRVLITRALMGDPHVVVLDEPCTGLDLAGREWVLHTIDMIRASASAPSQLLTTHHVEEIAEGFTHALLIDKGRVFAAGSIDEIFTGENLGRLFDLNLQVTHANGRWAARSL
jgi:iron complex transport system ATP-binding protein